MSADQSKTTALERCATCGRKDVGNCRVEVGCPLSGIRQPTAPTEAMCDAAIPLFLYFAGPPATRFTLGQHMAAGGWCADGLTPNQLAHSGVFPKGERAAMVWSVMEAARGKQS